MSTSVWWPKTVSIAKCDTCSRHICYVVMGVYEYLIDFMERPNKGCFGPDNWSQFCKDSILIHPIWGRYQVQIIHLRENKAEVQELVEGQQGWLGQR